MPFEKVNVKKIIKDELKSDPELSKMWDDSRMEYRLLSDLIRLRKEKGISQTELAQKMGSRQQEISRIEKREHSPTLKTLCHLANALDVDIMLLPRQ